MLLLTILFVDVAVTVGTAVPGLLSTVTKFADMLNLMQKTTRTT